MAWIKTIGMRDPAMTPALMEAYMAAGANLPPEYMGGSDAANIVQTHSLDPTALRLSFGAGLHLINGPGPLSRKEREMINTVVSASNKCFY